jgi:phytoene/squalene synthetase
MQAVIQPTTALAAMITRQASKQTYTTIRMLVPEDRRGDAFRAYAYFRWLDDLLDGEDLTPEERPGLLASQKQLLNQCLKGQPPRDLSAEEWMLVDLTQGLLGKDPGLRTYLKDMMAVMEFDVGRRGRRISLQELGWYSRRLATAVTEAVYTFIGDECSAPRTTDRYLAADGAHIVHMLRDLLDDLDAGYINVPSEVLDGEQVDPAALQGSSVRAWVRERVETARSYFAMGEAYLASIENPRCRMAGALYAARFEGVLDAIEREGYRLRRDYSDCKGGRTILRMARQGLAAVVIHTAPFPAVLTNPVSHHAAAWERLHATPFLREDSVKQ